MKELKTNLRTCLEKDVDDIGVLDDTKESRRVEATACDYEVLEWRVNSAEELISGCGDDFPVPRDSRIDVQRRWAVNLVERGDGVACLCVSRFQVCDVGSDEVNKRAESTGHFVLGWVRYIPCIGELLRILEVPLGRQ